MKITNFVPLVMLMTILFSGCGGSGQVNQSDVLSHIDDTERYSVMELAEMDQNLSTFVELVELSGLDTSVEFAESFTVFIPTNEAFAEMSVEELARLSDPANRAELNRFISRHFLPNEVMSGRFEEDQVIDTAGDESIAVGTVGTGNAVITIGGATIIKSDIEAADGIIHIVDSPVNADVEVGYGDYPN